MMGSYKPKDISTRRERIRERCKLSVSTDEANAYRVSKGNNTWIFPEREGLYTFIKGVDEKETTFFGIQTVEKNLEGFTKEEIQRANKAIRALHMLELYQVSRHASFHSELELP